MISVGYKPHLYSQSVLLNSWLLYFLIQVNYLITFAFNLALGNPAVRDEDLIRITCLSGESTPSFDEGENHGTSSMILTGGAFTYYLTVVLRTTPLEPQERSSSSQEVHIPQVRPGISEICHIPNFHLCIPSLTKHDQAPPSITASPDYSDLA